METEAVCKLCGAAEQDQPLRDVKAFRCGTEWHACVGGWRDGRQSDRCRIRQLEQSLAAVTKERDDLLAFKTYVHKRLDEADVPHEVPESEHTKAGCRVGGRIDWLLERLDCFEATCGDVLDTLVNWGRDDGEAGEALRFAVANRYSEPAIQGSTRPDGQPDPVV